MVELRQSALAGFPPAPSRPIFPPTIVTSVTATHAHALHAPFTPFGRIILPSNPASCMSRDPFSS